MASIIIGIISTAIFVVLVHFLYLAVFKPNKCVVIIEKASQKRNSKEYIHFITILFGALIFGYGGAKAFFSWIPESYGSYNEYSDYITITHSLSVFVAMFAVGFVFKLMGVAEDAIHYKIAKIETKELQNIINASPDHLLELEKVYRDKAEAHGFNQTIPDMSTLNDVPNIYYTDAEHARLHDLYSRLTSSTLAMQKKTAQEVSSIISN